MTFSDENYREVADFVNKNSSNKPLIVAVSKNHPQEEVKKAILSGVRIFGENRVQEATNKFTSLKAEFKDIELHLTGPLQTNKVKNALSIFDVFQTLDRKKLAIEFCKYQELVKNKKFFIQVNTGKEENKSGVLPENTEHFVGFCRDDLSMNIVGLMCIPPLKEDPVPHFLSLKELSDKSGLRYVSMGMSGDFKEAILNGATHIRVGTKIFGSR